MDGKGKVQWSTDSIADRMPFDPQLPTQVPPNGYGLIYNNITSLWEAKAVGTSSSGVTPPFTFSKSGFCIVGGYLYVGQVVSSKTGEPIAGSNYLVKLSVSNSTNVAANTTLQLQRRTAVATFVDIAGAFIVIPAGNYKANSVLATPIAIGPDWELSCYNKSGSTLNDGVFYMYLVPA